MEPKWIETWQYRARLKRDSIEPSSNDIHVPTKNGKNLLKVISTYILIYYVTVVQMFLQINKETSGMKYHRAVNE
jgi:hypothetical protein